MSAKQYHLQRRITQFVTLLLIVAIPVSGLFRIDLASASFFILGRQVWWSNFYFMFGLFAVLITGPLLAFLTIGSAWCGWGCPQNFLAEWANSLTQKLLGKRADMRVDGQGMVVASAKNKILNWLILAASITAVSMLLALVVFLLFYSQSDVWHFIIDGSRRPVNMTIMYLFVTFLIFIDIAAIRYFLCDYACVYRVGQRLFKPRHALHVVYDASRSSECSKCNYCSTNCITRIEPTNIKKHDTCIDCAECIDSCNRLHEKSATSGLLSFKIGDSVPGGRNKFGKAFVGNVLLGAIFLLGCGMMAWGVAVDGQKLVDQQKGYKEQQTIQRIAHVCNSQCASVQASCNGKNIAGCYRAAACKCECSLQQDPANESAESWRQCVKDSNAHAEAANQHVFTPAVPAKP